MDANHDDTTDKAKITEDSDQEQNYDQEQSFVEEGLEEVLLAGQTLESALSAYAEAIDGGMVEEAGCREAVEMGGAAGDFVKQLGTFNFTLSSSCGD